MMHWGHCGEDTISKGPNYKSTERSVQVCFFRNINDNVADFIKVGGVQKLQDGEFIVQIVECTALRTLILMLRSEDAAIHYEAVGVIGNLVHSSPNIKKEVLVAGALQPVIGLLSSCCSDRQREAALLLGQFAATDSDCKVHIVQRGAVQPLIEMLQSPDVQLREMSAFALGRLAQVITEEMEAIFQ
ncbi:hypothetical protein ACSBR2_031163 [Camellia fascicularis]